MRRALLFALLAGASSCSVALAQTSDLPLGIAENLAIREIGAADGGIHVSADGEHVAFIEREVDLEGDRYRHRVSVLDVGAGRSRAIGDAGDFIHHRLPTGRSQGSAAMRRPLFSPDGGRVGFLYADDDGIYLDAVTLATGARTRLVDGPGDVQRFVWTDAGDIVAEIATPRDELLERAARFRRDGFLVDLDFDAQEHLFPLDDLRSGRQFIVVDVRSVERRSASTEEIALLDGSSSSDPARTSTFSARNRAGLSASIRPVESGNAGGRPVLGLYAEGAGSAPCVLAACQGEIVGPWVDAAGAIYFIRIEAPTRTTAALYAWDPARNVIRRVRSAEDLLIGCEMANVGLICLRESPLEPRRLVSIDLVTGRMRTLHEPNPQWPSFRLTRVERIDVEDAYGQGAFGQLVYPPGYDRRRSYPLVVVQYRARGFLRGGVGGEYPIHALAQRGYFVLSVERPPHVGSRTRQSNVMAQFEEELAGAEQRSKLSALEALLDRVLARVNVDPARIGITGMSDGAETAYWALRNTRRFAVAVLSTPPLDPLSYLLVSERFTLDRRERAGRAGPWPDSPEPWASYWADKPSVHHIDDYTAPIMLQLADREALPAFPFYRRMREHGRAVEMYIYPDAHHAKMRPRQLLAAQMRAIAWLDFWLRGVEIEDASDPARLSRWRAWRDARH